MLLLTLNVFTFNSYECITHKRLSIFIHVIQDVRSSSTDGYYSLRERRIASPLSSHISVLACFFGAVRIANCQPYICELHYFENRRVELLHYVILNTSRQHGHNWYISVRVTPRLETQETEKLRNCEVKNGEMPTGLKQRKKMPNSS